MAFYKVVVVDEDGQPRKGVTVAAYSLANFPAISARQTTDDAGQAVFTGISGPHFFDAFDRRGVSFRDRSYEGKIQIQIVANGGLCYDFVVDPDGFGTHETLDGADGAWEAAWAALDLEINSSRNIWICCSTTLTTPLSLASTNPSNGVSIIGPGVDGLGGRVVVSAPAGDDMFHDFPGNTTAVTFRGLELHVDAGFGLYAGSNTLRSSPLRFEQCSFDMAGAALATNRNGVHGLLGTFILDDCLGTLGTLYEYANGSGNGNRGEVRLYDCDLTITALWEWDGGAFGFKTGPEIFDVQDSRITVSTQQPLNRAGSLRIKDSTITYNVANTLFSGDMSTLDSLFFQNLRFLTATSGANLFNVTGTPDNIFMVNVIGYSTVAQAGTFITLDAGATASYGDIFAPAWATVLSGPASSGGAPVYAHTHADNTEGGTVSHDDLTGVSADDHHAQIHATAHQENGGDELDVGTLGSGVATNGQVPVADGAGGVAWMDPAGGGAGIITMLADSLDNEWTDMPAALTELFGQTHHRTKIDLSNASTVRMVARIETAGAAGSELRAQYSTDETTWNYLDGGTGPTVAIDATGVEVSATVNLAAGAQADVFLRIVGIDGDGAADPVFGHITLQFDAVGGGGGGGGGAPQDSKYVVTEADGTLSGEVVRQQLGNYFADTYPASPNAMDDEFDDTAGNSGAVNGLDAKWTWRNQGTATATFTLQGYLTLTPPASATPNIRIIEQNEPAGDYTVEAKVSMEGPKTNWIAMGIVAMDGTNQDHYQFAIRSGTTVDWEVVAQRWSALTTFSADVIAGEDWTASTVYMRVKYINATTTFEFWVSTDGIGWLRVGTFTDTVGVTKIGLFVNDETNSGLTKAHFDYFRRVA